ncbi:MAG TPA: glycoside hydrolase family 95 protein, partial [Vicinamibacterales bacterium]|nr:glycoside hydrolase family 95 protein [Vicinamibacterales bacterium]
MGCRASRAVIVCLVWLTAASAVQAEGPATETPATVLWYTQPAGKWENALPVGNGRLGAMVFGRTDEETIQLNEDTYWSGGPYSTTVSGGHQALPEIRRLLFDGQLVQAHRLFGRHLMGYPVEQQKYQSMGNLVLRLPAGGAHAGYRHELDLDTAVVTTVYERDGTKYRREVFSSPVDQVVVARLTAEPPGRLSFSAQLRGDRNQAHSNYATDYFRMDGDGPDGLVVRGKSADYLGVAGRLRYTVRLRAVADGGRISVEGDRLIIREAASVTLLIAAATSFVNYKDVGADPDARVETVLRAAGAKPYADLKAAHIAEHRR